MATNRLHAKGTRLSLAATAPATPVSGNPVLVGQIPGVALTGERADGTVSIQTDGVFNLPVTTTATALAAGDIVNYAAGAVGNAAGVRFGYALAAVAASSTATIPVKIGY